MSATIAVNHGSAAIQLDAAALRRSGSALVAAYSTEELIEATRMVLRTIGDPEAEHYLARLDPRSVPTPAEPAERTPAVVRVGSTFTLAGVPGENPTQVRVTHVEAEGRGYRISAVPA